jgi:hypothetical protein
MISRLRQHIIGQSKAQSQTRQYHDLIRKEAVIGGKLFGSLPKGHRREFFCLDEHTWVWHEEWLDSSNQKHEQTTRYDVRPGGVLKMQDGQTYQAINPTEAKHLLDAIKLYQKRVMTDLYSQT